MDLYWRDLLATPTEQEYLDMVSNSMFSLHIPIGATITDMQYRDGRTFPVSRQAHASRIKHRPVCCLFSMFDKFVLTKSTCYLGTVYL